MLSQLIFIVYIIIATLEMVNMHKNLAILRAYLQFYIFDDYSLAIKARKTVIASWKFRMSIPVFS